jgi:peptidoglycan L-alanyl-D-glutamate endopeptidase CwlK
MASNDSRDVNLDHLHAKARDAIERTLAELKQLQHPFEIFEAYRTPQRQAWLYAQGRTRPGGIVTKAEPWESYHQYGLAADFVLKVGGNWSWDTGPAWKSAWDDLHTVGAKHGLQPLSWELPHLQMAGLRLSDLQNGRYPAGGGDNWAEHLDGQIAGWSGPQDPPPSPEGVRPELDPAVLLSASQQAPANGVSPMSASALPPVGNSDWHDKFGGQEWMWDEHGIYLRADPSHPLRTPGSPTTVTAIWNAFGTIIAIMSRKYDIAPEILLMTIATEAAAYKDDEFTGPRTFRWEAHVWNRDVNPPVQGDYSAGPMQTLASTARWVIDAQHLPYHKFQVAPVFAVRPSPPPANHPLYDPATNIEIGAAEIRQRVGTTGRDPILVAAAFNAGGIYEDHGNPWHMRTYGNHLDRAAQWFGDACAVLKAAGVR